MNFELTAKAREAENSKLRIQNSKFLSVALYEPEIPPNAGNIARLCAATGTPLHLIGRLGFSFRHPDARRAGMDYWDQVELYRHINFGDFVGSVDPGRVWAMTTHGKMSLWEASFEPGDTLLFGPESRGLPTDILEASPTRCLRIPMRSEARSLNLATAVGIALYEGLRQLQSDSRLVDTADPAV
ncbi:MAG TPA: tRNA (cytidine(34)-2'-O)-methyltransferase [Longimicrobiaceae bacterium]|nr:tRNA (cytidine(34)-2'-O)-methyltransferase [Longimicrobiaceae bacterium]